MRRRSLAPPSATTHGRSGSVLSVSLSSLSPSFLILTALRHVLSFTSVYRLKRPYSTGFTADRHRNAPSHFPPFPCTPSLSLFPFISSIAPLNLFFLTHSPLPSLSLPAAAAAVIMLSPFLIPGGPRADSRVGVCTSIVFAVPMPFPPLLVTVEVSPIAFLSLGARLVTQEKIVALRGLVWLQPGCGCTCRAVDRDVQQGGEGQKSTGGTPCALLYPYCSVICLRVPACLS
uniref:Transmembrane protein n=1 Tax=Chromera velia CCMP2878 TaxID=1169474 RepID=A0A0G4HKU3_9ALVE|eukprot:Cvel_7334.t1-p1 / transcript=Cvel_7334.t1 / gene=Cvel_7334 / organism=Chromera_velia_CCMP2878 / gene_product=hypothetical protein / transcript_product=hypothetical protein / location=Cvel_scaffold380:41223-41912(-) / protein_length=230 / sequence_SO=supercontig / SO=protein_coding / is_pseudo=false